MVNIDVAVIGGGSAGMAAALSAKENGVENILILEKTTLREKDFVIQARQHRRKRRKGGKNKWQFRELC